jgi:hypothetical protein
MEWAAVGAIVAAFAALLGLQSVWISRLLDAHVGAIVARLDRIDARLDRIENRLSDQGERIAGLEAQS